MFRLAFARQGRNSNAPLIPGRDQDDSDREKFKKLFGIDPKTADKTEIKRIEEKIAAYCLYAIEAPHEGSEALEEILLDSLHENIRTAIHLADRFGFRIPSLSYGRSGKR